MQRTVRGLLRLAGLLIAGVSLVAPTAARDLPAGTVELTEYLQQFDRHAHASEQELKAELLAPALMVRGGYGGPAVVRSLTRDDLDQKLTTPLPEGFVLQRVQVLAEGPVAAANLVYQATAERREVDLGLLLARDGKSWKVAALVISPPLPDPSLSGKFVKQFEAAARDGGPPLLALFEAPIHRIASQGPGFRPEAEALTQERAGLLLGLPASGHARVQKVTPLAVYIDSAIAAIHVKTGASSCRSLVLLARTEQDWKIVAVARE